MISVCSPSSPRESLSLHNSRSRLTESVNFKSVKSPTGICEVMIAAVWGFKCFSPKADVWRDVKLFSLLLAAAGEGCCRRWLMTATRRLELKAETWRPDVWNCFWGLHLFCTGWEGWACMQEMRVGYPPNVTDVNHLLLKASKKRSCDSSSYISP